MLISSVNGLIIKLYLPTLDILHIFCSDCLGEHASQCSAGLYPDPNVLLCCICQYLFISGQFTSGSCSEYSEISFLFWLPLALLLLDYSFSFQSETEAQTLVFWYEYFKFEKRRFQRVCLGFLENTSANCFSVFSFL